MTNRKQPEIRFSGFTDDWEERKLAELGKVTTGKAFSSTSFDEQGEYLVITNKDISESSRSQNVITDKINIVDNELIQRYNLSGNNILITMDGVNLGKTALFSNEKALLAQRVGRIQSDQLEFMYQITSSDVFLMTMRTLSVGNAIKHISLKQIADYSSLVPKNVVEQQKIGSFFKKLDDTIALNQRKLDLLKEQKKGFLQKMFPKNGEKVPEIRFSGFTDDWEQRKFQNIVDVNSGKDYKHLNAGTIPVYGTGGYMLSVDKSLSDNDAIGIGRKGTIDKPYLLKAPFWTVDTLFYAVTKPQVDLQFALAIFKNVNWKKFDESTGVPSLSKVVINNVKVFTPNYEEQQQIGTFFKLLDDTIALNQRELELLKELKKGFLQKMFI